MVNLWGGNALPINFGSIDVWCLLYNAILEESYAWRTFEIPIPIVSPTVKVQEFSLNSLCDYTINRVIYKTTGTLAATFSPLINNSNITGATSLSATTTEAFVNPSANNNVVAGDDLKIDIASVTGSGDLIIKLYATRNSKGVI